MFRAVFILVLVTVLLSPIQHAGAQSSAILTVEREIAGLPYELGIGFDRTGRERWRFTGTADGVDMPEWMARSIPGGMFTHNHPGEGHCVNLSVSDVQFAAWYRLREIRAVGLENGVVYVAILRHPRWLTDAAYNRAFDNNRWRDWCTAIYYTWRDLGFDVEVIH